MASNDVKDMSIQQLEDVVNQYSQKIAVLRNEKKMVQELISRRETEAAVVRKLNIGSKEEAKAALQALASVGGVASSEEVGIPSHG